MLNLEILSLFCSILQIVGFLLILGLFVWNELPKSVWALICISGFAAIVQIFLPLDNHQNILYLLAAVCGFGLIIVGLNRILKTKLKTYLDLILGCWFKN